MLITRRLLNGDFQVEAFAEGIVAQAPTLEAAREELMATMSMKAFAAYRLRKIKKATHIAYDPQLGCYVADCPAVGIQAHGWTRQAAWDKFLYGLTLADKTRAEAEAAALKDAIPELEVGADAPEDTTNGTEDSQP